MADSLYTLQEIFFSLPDEIQYVLEKALDEAQLPASSSAPPTDEVWIIATAVKRKVQREVIARELYSAELNSRLELLPDAIMNIIYGRGRW